MLALTWDTLTQSGDLAREGGGRLADDPGLRTAVILSLFTDRRARADDETPDGDRGGWLGDALAPIAGDRFGSRLWLLRRAKHLPETLRRAEDYTREALAWLTQDGLARSIAVRGEWIATGVLALAVTIETVTERQALTFAVRL